MTRKGRKRFLASAVAMALISASAGAAVVLSDDDDKVAASANDPIELSTLDEMPGWAQRQLVNFELPPKSLLRSATVDLDADGTPEVLLTSAPPMEDVYMPTVPLTILRSNAPAVVSDYECQPTRLGAFKNNGHWDLACAAEEEGEEVMLRFDGERYGS